LKIKVASLYSLQALLIGIVIALVYLQMIAVPVFRGQSALYPFYVGDATLYMDPIHAYDYLRNIGREFFSINRSNMLGMLLLGKAALWISPQSPEYVVFCFNILVLAATIRNFQHIFHFYKSDKYRLFLLLFLMNPLVLMGTVALNKEIWGLFFISSFLKYRLYKKNVCYFITAVISFFIRDIYSIAGILFFLLSTLKIRKLYYLILISLLAPFVVSHRIVEYFLIEGQDASSIGFTVFLHKIQSLPFGYLFAYFPKLILDMFGPLNPIRFTDIDSKNWVGIFTMISAVLFLSFFSIVLYKIFMKKKFTPVFVNLFFSYTFIVCITPYIIHRYIFPIYPILMMLSLLYPQQVTDVK